MNQRPFEELNLQPEIKKAIDEMGFLNATEIQSQAIPLIRTGQDVIGRSMTGTGKTVAFMIPAIEIIDTKETHNNSPQVLILCPTRELAQQATEEIKKLTKYSHGIRSVEVYGGVPMDRQIVRLKRANVVIGTPGRVMDHMRRKTLKVNNLKMIILDEADEMLSMGFKEDIETILQDTPEQRQTILFSATMPPSIMSLTNQFQTNPKVVEITKKQSTLENIEQFFIDSPSGRKMDALNLLLRFYEPNLALIFCNTKKMVDEITESLNKNGFVAEGLHGDMRQSQRSKVMDSFKFKDTTLLVATDVAARGIDVNNIDYVINFDIPQNSEYYIHRIGRTGRAGKFGKAITICSGRRQVSSLKEIGRRTKSEIKPLDIPSSQDVNIKAHQKNLSLVEQVINQDASSFYLNMVNDLQSKGHPIHLIAAAALQMHFGDKITDIEKIETKQKVKASTDDGYGKMVINIGKASRVAPNHIVGAITERTNISGSDVGKIEILDESTIVSIPNSIIQEVLESMVGCKICGRPTVSTLVQSKPRSNKTFRHGDKFDRSKPRRKKR